MLNKHRFAERFSKKMLVLAVITGIVIATTLPLTYGYFSFISEQRYAVEISEEIAASLAESVMDNTQLWQFNTQKFIEIFASTDLGDVSSVYVFNRDKRLIREELVSGSSLFDIPGKASIRYNNQTFGYVEVRMKSTNLLYVTGILFVVFSIVGLIMGVAIYSFPTKIVAEAEKEVLAALDDLNYLSFHDPLTGLPNRSKLENELQRILNQARENNFNVAVLFIDLDGFKVVNDNFGHFKGDVMLKVVADRLESLREEGEVLARLGGDEFILVIPFFNQFNELKAKAQVIIDEMQKSLLLGEAELFITVSVGISIFPDDGEDSASLVKSADTAMYCAKQQGKNRYMFSSHNT